MKQKLGVYCSIASFQLRNVIFLSSQTAARYQMAPKVAKLEVLEFMDSLVRLNRL